MLTSVALVPVSPPSPALAQTPAAVHLDERDKNDIERIENWLNDLTTLSADFIQVSSTGEVAQGKLYISRPGRMRFEYDPPSPIMLIADGVFLIYIDKDLDQTTHLFLRRTPIGLLVKKDVSLTDGLAVTGFDRSPGVLRVSLADQDDPEKGTITLIFSDAPLALRQWVVIDQQGTRTQISLTNLRFGVALDEELFIHRE